MSHPPNLGWPWGFIGRVQGGGKSGECQSCTSLKTPHKPSFPLWKPGNTLWAGQVGWLGGPPAPAQAPPQSMLMRDQQSCC